MTVVLVVRISNAYIYKANRQLRKNTERNRKNTENPFSLSLSSIDKIKKGQPIFYAKDKVERQNKLMMTRMNTCLQSSTSFVLLTTSGLNFTKDSLSLYLPIKKKTNMLFFQNMPRSFVFLQRKEK
jgi:hypothetical protein